jgi:hypothetical protein
VSADRVGNDIITAAERVLRELNDGREPYAPSVMPMARVLAKLAQDPRFIMAAAEKLLKCEGVTPMTLDYTTPHSRGTSYVCDRQSLLEAYQRRVNDREIIEKANKKARNA